MMSQLYKVIQLILRGRAKIWALGFQSHDVKHDIDFLLYLSFQKHKHRRNFYHLLPIRKSFFLFYFNILFYFILFNLKFALEKKNYQTVYPFGWGKRELLHGPVTASGSSSDHDSNDI